MKNNCVFMAFASGKVSTEGERKLYTGVASVYVKAVNLDKAKLEKVYGRELENAPQYVGEVEIDGNKVPNVRLDFIIATDPDKCNGISIVKPMSFFIQKRQRVGSNSGKIQIIDKYGRTAWATPEEIKEKAIPMYKNGPANIDKDYRPAYVGEEELTDFIKNYLNIPNVMKYINQKWVMTDKPEECEARLEKIDNYFKGDFSELRTVLALQPNNKVKVLFGVRTTDDNRQYQNIYTGMTLKNNVSDYSRLDKHIQERKDNGGLSTTEFTIGDLKEYNVEATSFTETSGDMPFEAPAEEGTPWGFE